MSITTPISKPPLSFDNTDFTSFAKVFALTFGAQKFFKYLNSLQISKETRAWVWSREKHTSENRSAAIEKIEAFHKSRSNSSLYSQLDSVQEVSFNLDLQNLNLSSLPPFTQAEQITRIYINNNNLNDLTQLYSLENITHLYLRSALQCKSIDLQKFKKLQFVNLESNKITDLDQIQMPKHKIKIILDCNIIRNIPTSWMELHPETEISLLKNDLPFSKKKEILIRSFQEKGPIFSIDIVKIDQQNSKLEKIPNPVYVSEDEIGFINLSFNNIRQLTEDLFKIPGLYFVDLRDNPLSYETKSQIKAIQRRCDENNPVSPLILFDRYFVKRDPPQKSSEPERAFDFRSFFKLYKKQIQRDSQTPTH